MKPVRFVITEVSFSSPKVILPFDREAYIKRPVFIYSIGLRLSASHMFWKRDLPPTIRCVVFKESIRQDEVSTKKLYSEYR